MTMSSGGDGSDAGSNGKGTVGYRSPPLHGRIKPGEVRNPHGRNGKKKEEEIDPFEKVRRRLSRVTVDGKVSLVENEESFWLRQWSLAINGDKAASRLVDKKLTAMRGYGPPPPTAQKLAREAAELLEREQLSAEIVDALEELAELKREAEC